MVEPKVIVDFVFFQAEDGIRDVAVTGVQTCALPIAPELAGAYSDTTSPAFTRILGAGKLTGRLPGGLTIGVLDAVTQHVTGVGGVTIEPTSNYGVVRLRQDLRGGESSVGGIVTAVNRDNDAFTAPYLRRTAYVGGAALGERIRRGHDSTRGSATSRRHT